MKVQEIIDRISGSKAVIQISYCHTGTRQYTFTELDSIPKEIRQGLVTAIIPMPNNTIHLTVV